MTTQSSGLPDITRWVRIVLLVGAAVLAVHALMALIAISDTDGGLEDLYGVTGGLATLGMVLGVIGFAYWYFTSRDAIQASGDSTAPWMSRSLGFWVAVAAGFVLNVFSSSDAVLDSARAIPFLVEAIGAVLVGLGLYIGVKVIDRVTAT